MKYEIIKKLYAGENLKKNEMEIIFLAIMKGKFSSVVIASILTALFVKKETADEISAASGVALEMAVKFPRPDYKIGDIVGTGGDEMSTINVSTISAIVAAGVGLKICKHGNRKVSSRSGAADVLEKLGVNLKENPQQTRKTLDRAGICFINAPNYHRAFKVVSSVRAELKTKTIFNALGPLINPARVDYILNGVYSAHLLMPVAKAHKHLNMKNAMVVFGGGLDEVCLHSKTEVVELCKGKKIESFELSPSDFGLKVQSINSIKGGNVVQNAKIARDVIAGKGKIEHENIVSANVALLLRVAGFENNLKKGVSIAKDAMHNKSATRALDLMGNKK